jgi:hypothetical protein
MLPLRRRRPQALLAVSLASVLLLGAAPAESAATLTRVSRPSPFANCAVQPLPDELNYVNAEVEPWIAANPRNPPNLIGVWQQDRWQDGGARGLMTGASHDAGETWRTTFAHFTRCSGGTASNRGNYERASDPWATISPDGVAHQIALSFDFFDPNQAILVSNSFDGGDSWSEPIPLLVDTDPTLIDDKESITADPRDSRLVYAVWDLLQTTDATQTVIVRGPTLFSRTTDGGRTWEPARVIYDPGIDAQTIANHIVVLPNGDLLNLLVRLLHDNEGNPNPGDVTLAVIRSTDKGQTWSAPVIINTLESIPVTDPKTGEGLRTGDIIPNIAVDPVRGTVYAVWQDARFSGGARDGIAFARSRDGGRTWSAPQQVNQAPQVQAFTAAIHAAADAVSVTYYDLRHDNADPKVLLTDYWRIVSFSGGQSWHESHIAGPFDMRTAPDAGGFFVGDYEGLSSLSSLLPLFVPFFVMTNSGNLSNRTDVFAASPVDEGPGDASAIAPATEATSQAQSAVRPASVRTGAVRRH